MNKLFYKTTTTRKPIIKNGERWIPVEETKFGRIFHTIIGGYRIENQIATIFGYVLLILILMVLIKLM